MDISIRKKLDILKDLELRARALEPTEDQINHWNQEVFGYGTEFVHSLERRKAFEEWKGESLDFPAIPAKGRPIEELMEQVSSKVDHFGINPASGGHLGYIPGGGLYPSALGDYLAAVSNRYSGVFYANPAATRMENSLLEWFAEIFGYPKNCGGNLSSGGSIANLIAITTARDAKGIKGEKIARSVVYLTEQVHHCIHKALRIAGLSETIWRNVPLNEAYEMDVIALGKMLAEDKEKGRIPFLIVGSAGTTDTGAVDPFDALADLAERFGCWFHVDGAYGGAFALVEKAKAKFAGIERSDSLVIDPHKGLFIAYGLGVVLIKDIQAMQDAHYYQANYMRDAKVKGMQGVSPADLSPELTKHFRGMRLWMSLQLFGVEAFQAALEEKMYLCQYFYERIKGMGFEVGPFPSLSVCIYRWVEQGQDNDAINNALMKAVNEDGVTFISSTLIEGEVWLRLAVVSFRTHLWHVDHLIDILQKALKKALK